MDKSPEGFEPPEHEGAAPDVMAEEVDSMTHEYNEAEPSLLNDSNHDSVVSTEDVPSIPPQAREHYEQLDNEQKVSPSDVDDDTLVLGVNHVDGSDSSQPDAPELREHKFQHLNTVHVLGDLHGWAPGLITYLVEHELAEIEINGLMLGSAGELDAKAMLNLFGRDRDMTSTDLPSAGLAGRPRFEECVNGIGHSNVRARWRGGKKTGFIQLGDVIDRADHSELACEILRQLIIDAPGNVFVLLGNHEQFVIEDEYDNWYLNENRNAVVDGRKTPAEWSRHHLRFMPTMDVDDLERSRLVFEAYKESVQLLFLTQAAAQQKALNIAHGLSEDSIGRILSSGWSPYNDISKVARVYSKKGRSFPGGLVSIVIGETLFHHAEPNQKISVIPGEMSWEEGFGWLNYVHGGYNLQASPHSHLLWSRGASDGATINRPASQEMLEQIGIRWPGLYNIVHGHTPTVSIGEFDDVTGKESKPVSYLAESVEVTPKYGRASSIRIYNIDEGLSPVYYKGADEPEDPCRTPIGLRITAPSSREVPVQSHSAHDRLLEVERHRSVRTDTRKLWIWREGVYRNNNANEWKQVGKNRHQICSEFDGTMFLIEVSETGKEMLSRNISGYPILQNLLIYMLHDAKFLPRHIKRQPPKNALAHVRESTGGPAHLSHMLTPNMAWKTAQMLQLVALGLCPGNKKNTSLLFGMNFTKKPQPFFLFNHGEKSVESRLSSETIVQSELRHGSKPMCLSLEQSDIHLTQKLDQWLGKEKISSKLEQKIPLCLGLNPLEAYSDKEASTGIAGSQTKHWERPGKTEDIRDAQKEHPKQPLRELKEKVVKRMSKNPPQDIRDVPRHRRDGGPGRQKSKPLVNKSDRKKSALSSEARASALKSPVLDIRSTRPSPVIPPTKSSDSTPSADQKQIKQPAHVQTRHESIKEADGSTTVTITSTNCGKIIGQGKKKPLFLSHSIKVYYHPKWLVVTFEIFDDQGQSTFKWEAPRHKLSLPELGWGGSGIPKPSIKKKHHGLNEKFFMRLVEYVHELIQGDLRGD